MNSLKLTRSRRKLLTIAVAIVSIILATSYWRLSHHLYTSDKPTTGQAIPKNTAISPDAVKKTYGLPVRLKIPKLNLDAAILYMGLTSDGEMEVPTDLQNVGWYKYGPDPGDTGSAVIAGHLEGYKDRGVFMNLATLEPGDIVIVTDDAGSDRRFVVRESRIYGQHERPAEVFQTTDRAAHLNLVTCTGTWNESEKRYSQRLVVFTDKTNQ